MLAAQPAATTATPPASLVPGGGAPAAAPKSAVRAVDAAARGGALIHAELGPGDRFAHFKLVRLLGQGGMGRVFEAEHEFTRRRTALKLIRSANVDADMRERMVQEARSLAELQHPNIVTLYDANETGGWIWLAMEYLEGRTLRSRRNNGPLSVQEALGVLIDICDGVAAAHEIHIVHRDLKPENVVLTAQGATKVLDFGAAKVLRPRNAQGLTTAVGASGHRRVIGTPEYMSPEHLRGERVDHRTDSYAMGCISYELLARHPFSNPDGSMAEMYETVRRQFVDAPRPLVELAPHVPGYVAEPIHRALAKESALRPTVAELAAAFRQARARRRAESPDPDSAPFEPQLTGPGSWAAHGPAVSLPRHVAPPSDPSRRVLVQVPAAGAAPSTPQGVTVSLHAVPAPRAPMPGAAPASPPRFDAGVPGRPPAPSAAGPVLAGDGPRSHAEQAYGKTQELPVPGPQRGIAPPLDPGASGGGERALGAAPPMLSPEMMTVVPATVGPGQRASHPARVRARRTGVLVFLAVCSAGVVAVAALFLGRSSAPSGADVATSPSAAAPPAATTEVAGATDAADAAPPPEAEDAGATDAADAAPSGAPAASVLPAGSTSPSVAPAPAAPGTSGGAPKRPAGSSPAAGPAKPPAGSAKSPGIDLPFAGPRAYPTGK